MRVLLTRMRRIQHKCKDLPLTCYAAQHLRAFTDSSIECDCIIFCKFPPNGNAPSGVIAKCDDELPALRSGCTLMKYSSYKWTD